MDDKDLKALAANARRAALLALIAVSVAVLVLVIDNGIKRDVVILANKARTLLDEARELANGAKAAGEGREGGGAAAHPGDGVVGDAAAGTVLDKAGSNGGRPARGRKAGVAAGSRGDGDGAGGS